MSARELARMVAEILRAEKETYMEWMEKEELAETFVANGSLWSICVNAVSGEIVRSE